MLSTLLASATAFPEVELTFPNLFGGITLSYYQGFELFGIKIYWYGVLITIGVVLAYLYAMWRAKDFGLGKDRMFDVVFVALIMGFLGARIYYCVFQTLDPNSGMSFDIVTTFTTIRDGGLAIYGGVIGGFLGSPDWIFGMTSVDIIRRDGLEAGALVHPCFLYESVWCLVGFIALHFYSKKLRTFDGEIMLMYLAWYGLGRAWIEGLRTDSLMAGDFRISQVVAAACFVVCTVLVIVFKILTEKKHIPLYVNTEACRALNEADEKAEEQRREKKLAKKTEQAPSILSEDAENVTLNDDSSESSKSSESSEPETVSSEETETSESPEAANETTETSDETDESEEQ